MSTISTHVLDTARGAPAAGIAVTLECQRPDGWEILGKAVTNGDGRVPHFGLEAAALSSGVYRLRFEVEPYQTGFYPEVTIAFRVDNAAQHYHVPLLLSPFGYSTYRGS